MTAAPLTAADHAKIRRLAAKARRVLAENPTATIAVNASLFLALLREGTQCEDRFERAATDSRLLVEVEEGAACIAYFEGVNVTNGQASVAECFDDAYAAVWGDGGVMRPEFQQRLDDYRAKCPSRDDLLGELNAVDRAIGNPRALDGFSTRAEKIHHMLTVLASVNAPATPPQPGLPQWPLNAESSRPQSSD